MHDGHVEPQKHLERVSSSNDAALTLLAEGVANISKYPRHLSDIAGYDGNPCNQVLVRVYGTCLNKTLHMAPEEEV